MTVTLAVIAKAPRPGQVKTRLCPPCTAEEAARIASALLDRALALATSVAGARPAILLAGPTGPWIPAGIEVVPQRGETLGERLAFGFHDLASPAIALAMDSPDITKDDLALGVDALAGGADAVLGPSEDGGYWAIGLRAPRPDVFAGVPMSTLGTLDAQRARLEELGLRRLELASRPDVDDFADAVAAADRWPGSPLAAAVAAVEDRIGAAALETVARRR